MGETLAKIFKTVEEKGGIPSRIKLASLTGLSKKDAEEAKDKPEIIEKFITVANQILGFNIDEYLR